MSCPANAGAAIAVDRTAAAVKSFRFIRCLLVVTPGQRLAMEDVAKFHRVPLQTDVRFLFLCWNELSFITRYALIHRASSSAEACTDMPAPIKAAEARLVPVCVRVTDLNDGGLHASPPRRMFPVRSRSAS